MGTPANLVALQAARERATSLVSERYAQNLLDDADLERRIDAIERAGDLEALAALTADLEEPAPGGQALAPLAPMSRAALGPAAQRVTTVLGSTVRSGPWTPARSTHVLNVLGSSELDFREATLPPGVTELELRVVLGSVTLTVPPDLRVDNLVVGVLGAVDVGGAAPTGTGDRCLRVSGRVVLGAVDIRVKPRGER